MLHLLLLSRLSPLKLRNPAEFLHLFSLSSQCFSIFLLLSLSFLHSGHWKFGTPVNLFSPEHLLWHQFLHSIYNIEFDPTPFLQHQHAHFPDFIFCVLLLPVAIILVFSMLTLSPLNSSSFLHLTNLSNTSCSDSAVSTR